MAKKTKTELAAEGKTIKETLGAAKMTPHAFALFHGPDDLIFHAHKTKSKSQMRQLCKADGATQKGAVGMLENEGPIVNLVVEDPDSTPANFAKAFKKFLQARGISKKVRLLDSDRGVLDAGEDEDGEVAPATGAPAPTADAAPDIGDDIDVVLGRILKAFEKIKIPLTRSLNSAPADHKAKLDTALDLFKRAMKAKNADNAKKALLALNKLVASTPSVVRINDSVTAAAGDPEKLGKLDGMVAACRDQAAGAKGDAFINNALPELRALRSALKDAIATKPPPANVVALRTMKAEMDMMFYDHVDKPPKSHGPQCHGPGLSVADQEDRILKNVNPRTKKKAKGKPVYKASNFTDESAFVDSHIALRGAALKEIEDKGIKPKPAKDQPPRIVVEDTLANVVGAGWEKVVQGVKRKQKKGQPDTCVAATWGPDSTCKAIYDLLSDGTLRLVTLYPNPIAPKPAPKPKPTAFKKKKYKKKNP